jgi:hypothetical protein
MKLDTFASRVVTQAELGCKVLGRTGRECRRNLDEFDSIGARSARLWPPDWRVQYFLLDEHG